MKKTYSSLRKKTDDLKMILYDAITNFKKCLKYKYYSVRRIAVKNSHIKYK